MRIIRVEKNISAAGLRAALANRGLGAVAVVEVTGGVELQVPDDVTGVDIDPVLRAYVRSEMRAAIADAPTFADKFRLLVAYLRERDEG